VAVAVNARRRGIAEKMCLQCEGIAKGWGYKEVALAVDSNNAAAKKLYQKKLRYSVLWDEISSTKIVARGSMVRAVPTTTTALVKQII
jgi:ribosomal protein S18 acetylase RimI-like enzyme